MPPLSVSLSLLTISFPSLTPLLSEAAAPTTSRAAAARARRTVQRASEEHIVGFGWMGCWLGDENITAKEKDEINYTSSVLSGCQKFHRIFE